MKMTTEHNGNEDQAATIFRLPENDEWRKLLREKIVQYNNFFASEMRYQPAEVVETSQRGYAKLIIETLLKEQEVNSWQLSRELFEDQGTSFHLGNFNKACGVVERYITNFPFLKERVAASKNR